MPQSHRKIEARLLRHATRIAAFRKLILAWYRRQGRVFPWRDPEASEYVQVVSELLLQRTRAETVAAFFPAFIERFPSWKHLAAATEAELRTFLEPIGLWQRRAATLRKLGKAMELRKNIFPSSREEMEQLPGVGQYVASAALMFCHGTCEPLLDVNMARVLERVFGPRKLVDIRYDPWLQALARFVVRTRRAPQLNWAILDLAAAICTPRNPKCRSCPAGTICLYAIRRRAAPRVKGPPGTNKEPA